MDNLMHIRIIKRFCPEAHLAVGSEDGLPLVHGGENLLCLLKTNVLK